MDTDIKQTGELVEKQMELLNRIRANVSQVIVGQSSLIDGLLIGLLTRGHLLLEGVPGLAKTLTVSTLASSVDVDFQRIQFTPDMLPADILGTTIFDPREGTFYPRQGPIFANLILADEINRAPAKVQSALLEAMQERQVTLQEKTFSLEEPFLVLATQNPIEQEGTYPLPEAQVDRFMLKLSVGYPSKEEEKEILKRMSLVQPDVSVQSVASKDDVLRARDVVDKVYVDEKVTGYVIDLVAATRDPSHYGIKEMTGLIRYGGSPRAGIHLFLAAKAHAVLAGRGYVTPADVKAMARAALRHRVIPTYEAEAEELTSDDLVQKILDHVPVP
jgi:MoxR-like ATPase